MAGPVLDADTLWEQFDDDAELLGEVVEIFREDCPRRLDDARRALSQQDSQALFRAAHSIKGTASTLAATATHAAAHNLEQLGRAGNLQEAPEALALLEAELGRMFAALEELQAP